MFYYTCGKEKEKKKKREKEKKKKREKEKKRKREKEKKRKRKKDKKRKIISRKILYPNQLLWQLRQLPH